jgi:hypothetical protein
VGLGRPGIVVLVGGLCAEGSASSCELVGEDLECCGRPAR